MDDSSTLSGRAWDEIVPGVWIGRWLSDAEARAAVESGVTAVLDLSDAFSEARSFTELNYLHLPVLDLTAPTPAVRRCRALQALTTPAG